MAVRFLFDATFIFAIVVSLVMSDADSFLNDGLSAPDTEFSLNDQMFAFDQSTLPMNLDVLPQDGSDLFLENVKNGGLVSNDGVGESFELADCSSSEMFPALGKSRMRRRDGVSECKNSASTPPGGSLPPFDAAGSGLFGSPGMMTLFNTVTEKTPENINCGLFTLGALNFGVCHTGEGALDANYPISFNGARFGTVNLQNGSPAPGPATICPPPEQLFCCARAYYDLNDAGTNYRGNYRGDICISISALMGEPQG